LDKLTKKGKNMTKVINKIKERWGDNPVVMRSQIVDFSCGLISSPQIIKNLETKHPNIIKGKFTFGKRKIGYPTESVLEFLETNLFEERNENAENEDLS
jgi:flagellar biosynthesis GTPase FlhF